jgi:hypothetical protein
VTIATRRHYPLVDALECNDLSRIIFHGTFLVWLYASCGGLACALPIGLGVGSAIGPFDGIATGALSYVGGTMAGALPALFFVAKQPEAAKQLAEFLGAAGA